MVYFITKEMGTIDEIKSMQAQGKSEQEISLALKKKGMSYAQITEGFSQAKIKDAVGAGQSRSANFEVLAPVPGGESEPQNWGASGISSIGRTPADMDIVQSGSPDSSEEYSAASQQTPAGYSNMEPSMMEQTDESSGQEDYGGGTQNYGEGYGSEAYNDRAYPEYQPYQEGMSSDVIKEISEQVVEERLNVLKDKMEEAIKFKIPAETKLKNIDERMRNVEQVLDKLQLAILSRIGEYVGDVKDIKHELEETQKSFKSLLPYHHKKAHEKNNSKRHGKSKGKKRVP